MEPPKATPPSEKKLWFRAKNYGYGWHPATWQGWSLICVYVVAIFFSAWDILSGAEAGGAAVKRFIITVIVLSFFLVYFSYKHGEKPHWRWGKPDDEA